MVAGREATGSDPRIEDRVEASPYVGLGHGTGLQGRVDYQQ